MKIDTIQKIVELIEIEKTGPPFQFANQLKISERMLYNYLDILKNEFAAPISFCKIKQSYYFNEKGKLDLTWQEGV